LQLGFYLLGDIFLQGLAAGVGQLCGFRQLAAALFVAAGEQFYAELESP